MNGNLNLLGNQKTKVIETGNLTIKGHLLKWDDVIIQIRNISMITTSDMQTPAFPFAAILMVLFGLFLLTNEDTGIKVLGTVFIVIGAIVLYVWYNKVQTLKERKHLNIMLNSGFTYSIVFYKKEFLNEVMQVFSNILEETSEGNVNYNINLEKCEIKENASVVRNIR